MVEAGGARVVGEGAWRGLELEQSHAAGAEPGGLCVAVDDVQPDRLVVEIGEPRQVACLEADRADAQRRRIRESDGGGGILGVHGGGLSLPYLYWQGCGPNNAVGRKVAHAPPQAGRPGQRQSRCLRRAFGLC